MKTHEDKTSESISQLEIKGPAQAKRAEEGLAQFKDNRPETAQLKQIQEMANDESPVKQLKVLQSMANTHAGIVQMRGRDHSSRVYKVTVSAQWLIDGELHIEPSESYSYPYTSDDEPTAPLERQAKRDYRVDHPNVPDGGPGMRMNVNGRALQG